MSSYRPYTWSDGDVLETSLLNHIENGIAEAIADTTGYENTSNKVQTIGGSATTTQYPSARAVYNLFNSIPNANNIKY